MSVDHPRAFPGESPRPAPAPRVRGSSADIVGSLALGLGAFVALCSAAGCKRLETGSGAQYSSGYNIDNLPPAPSNMERDFTCPVAHPTLDVFEGEKVVSRFLPAGSEKAALWNGLDQALIEPPPPAEAQVRGYDAQAHPRRLIAPGLHITVILIRRHNGLPHYLYLSNGTQDKAFQPWSSSKYMAFAALGSRLREASGGVVGLDGDIADPNGGRAPLGDLVTEATTYEFSCSIPKYCRGARHVSDLTSNNVATWAKNLAGRTYSEKLVRDWLGRTGERFDGGYQKYQPEYTARGNGWGFTVRQAGDNPTGLKTVTLRPGAIPNETSNRLSTYTMAEFLKRLVMHRENPAQAVPFLKWADVATLLYGAPASKSKYFPHMKVGGMQGGSSSFIQAAFDKTGGGNDLEPSTRGQWRTFTKIGWGPGGPSNNDFAWHGYGCVPRFDELGRATPDGREFLISAFLPGERGRTDAKQDAILTKAIKQVVGKIMNGEIAPMSPRKRAGESTTAVPPSQSGTPRAEPTLR